MIYTEKRKASINRLNKSDCEQLQLKNACKIAHKTGTIFQFLCVSFRIFLKFILFSRKFTPLFNRYKMIDKHDEI